MNCKTLKYLLHFLVISTTPFSASVFAHDQTGVLGPDSSATDYYSVQCVDQVADRFEVSVITKGGGKTSPLVSLQVSADDVDPVTITNVTDAKTGDRVSSRTAVILNNGTPDSEFKVSVNKNKSGTQKYEFKYHCLSGGTHTGTQITTLQNQ